MTTTTRRRRRRCPALQQDRRRPSYVAAAASALFSMLLVPAIVVLADGGTTSTTTTRTNRAAPAAPPPIPSPYRIVLDGGSTGTRLHVFEFTSAAAIDDDEGGGGSSSENAATAAAATCRRLGSAKAWTPLSSFARPPSQLHQELNATHVVHHLLPLFEYASELIPSGHWDTTSVRLAATAGMRLVEPPEQEAVYDAIYRGLVTNDGRFAFGKNFRRIDVGTLDGEREGYYGALAANYLKGYVDATLRVLPPSPPAPSADEIPSSPPPVPSFLLRYPPEQEEEEEELLGECCDEEGRCYEDARDTWHGPDHSHHRHGPIGALDMGGSSTQIVYRPAAVGGGARDTEKEKGKVRVEKKEDDDAGEERLEGDDFFSVSHLSYGVDRFRERLWDRWILDSRKREEEREEAEEIDGKKEDEEGSTCASDVLENPCGFRGHEVERSGYVLLGTGDARRCAEEVNRLLPHRHDDDDKDGDDDGEGGSAASVVDLDALDAANDAPSVPSSGEDGSDVRGRFVAGVEHPPLRGKFYAMSLYFFALDCLRELSHGGGGGEDDHREHHQTLNLQWPTPSIEELTNALDGFCNRRWQGDLEEIQHEAHEYTFAEQLPHRCLEATYMVTLLRDGYGFHPTSRDITFAFDVNGNEVEWTLGLALEEYAEETRRREEWDAATGAGMVGVATEGECPFDYDASVTSSDIKAPSPAALFARWDNGGAVGDNVTSNLVGLERSQEEDQCCANPAIVESQPA